MRLSNREKVMVGTATAVVAIMCFYAFLYAPLQKHTLRLKVEIEAMDLDIDRIKEATSNLSKLEEQVASEQKRMALIKMTISGEEQLIGLLRQLAGESHRLAMDVISLGSGKEWDSSPGELYYRRLPVEINIQCRYEDLIGYLERLQELPGLVTIDEFHIERGEEIFPKLQVELSLSTFVLGQ